MPDNTVDLKIRFKTDTEELEKLKKKIKELGSIDLTSDQSKELKAREKRAKTNMKNAANRGDEKSYNTYHNEVLQLQKQLLASVTVKNKDLIDTYIKAADKLSQQEKALNKAQARLNKQQKLFYSDSNDLFVSKMNWGYGGKNAPKDKKSQRMIAGVAGLRATLSNSSSVDEVINQANNLISNDPSLKGKDFISSKSAKSIKSQLKGGTTEAQIKEVVDILLEKMIAHAKKSFASKEIAPATADLKSAQEGFSLEKKIFNTIEQQIFPGSKTKEIIKNIDTQTSTNKKRNITLSNQKLDDEVKKDLNKVKNNAKAEENFVKASKKTESFGKKLFKTFSFGAILRQLRQLGQVAIQTITQLDQALTTQAMVSGRTRQETYALLGSYQSLAKQCGATSTEVAQVATAYLRQGKTASEAVKLTETAVKAAKVAGIDTATSVDYLTTAINGFQMSAEQSMEVSDKFAALAASAAVSYDELATALSKVAAQANLAGLSMDYTMALLTKGIETTRESAESIGTALKTVLARMREVSDYGETLDGSLSINNVEQQLSYVGIQLKDTNGELKSTEVVLNELGNKWDSLNSNQQAAIAKALAGTRQQSRLIAMMQDYERTNELLLISQRSLGATEAQMATYMSGMEAAINKVKSSYEGLISAFTNSDIIINTINGFAKIVEALSQNLWLLIIPLTAIGLVLLANAITTKAASLAEAGLTKEVAKGTKGRLLQMAAILGIIPVKTAAAVATKGLAKAEEIETAKVWSNNAAWYANPIIWIAAIIIVVVAAIGLLIYALVNMTSALEKNNKRMQELTVAIYNLEKSAQKIDTLVAKFEDLDNKILKSTEDLKELDNILSQIADTLSEDQQKVFNTLDRQSKLLYAKSLSQAQRQVASALRDQRLAVAIQGHSLNGGKLTEGGVAAVKDSYLSDLTSNIEKGNYSSEEKVLLSTFSDNLASNINAEDIIKQAQIQGSAEFSKKDAKQLAEKLGIKRKEAEKILAGDFSSVTSQEQMSVITDFLKEKGYDGQTFNTDWMAKLSQQQIANIKVLQEQSTDYGTAIEAFKSLEESTKDMPEVSEALRKQYTQLIELDETFGDSIKNQAFSFSIAQLQDLQDALKDFGEESTDIIKSIISSSDAESLASNIQKAVDDAILKGIIDGNDEKAIEAYRNRLQNIIAGSVLDSAQSVTSARNSVSNIYATMQKKQKGELSTLDEATFLSENADLFKDEKFYKAWQSGDWNAINDALGGTEYFKNLQDQTLESLNKGLAAAISEGNLAMQDFYREAINSVQNSLLSTSLENIKEIQDAQINAYKNALQKENDLLVSSLNKKKEAYQKYFDAIKEQNEDTDYLEQRDLLISNISKLGATSSATSQKQAAELESQLQDLEKERVKEMRQRAQEALIKSIDDEIASANDKLEDLTNSTEKILQAIIAQDNKGELVGQIALADLKSGANAADLATAIRSNAKMFNISEEDALKSMFSKIGDVKLAKDEKNNMILNVAGTEVNLTPIQGDTLYNTIIKVLNDLKLSV